MLQRQINKADRFVVEENKSYAGFVCMQAASGFWRWQVGSRQIQSFSGDEDEVDVTCVPLGPSPGKQNTWQSRKPVLGIQAM